MKERGFRCFGCEAAGAKAHGGTKEFFEWLRGHGQTIVDIFPRKGGTNEVVEKWLPHLPPQKRERLARCAQEVEIFQCQDCQRHFPIYSY